MADKLIAQSESDAWEWPLRREVLRLGSGRTCDLCVPHGEVPPHAVTLDCRGDSVLIRNENNYDIYVGDRSVVSGGWLDWIPGEVVLLTRNVKLQLKSDKARSARPVAATAPAAGQSGPLSTKQIWQLIVIALCSLVGVFLLLSESIEPQTSGPTFESVSANIAKALGQRPLESASGKLVVNVRDALRDAHDIEARNSPRTSDGTARAIDEYERVLEASLRLADASAGTATEAEDKQLAGEARDFAVRKLAQLRAIMSQR